MEPGRGGGGTLKNPKDSVWEDWGTLGKIRGIILFYYPPWTESSQFAPENKRPNWPKIKGSSPKVVPWKHLRWAIKACKGCRNCESLLWKNRSYSKCYAMHCFGTYFTHVQTCDNVRQTLHMSKPVITFVFKVLRNGLCFGIYFTHVQTCDNVHVQSATQWVASVHTLHMSKPVILYTWSMLRNVNVSSTCTHGRCCAMLMSLALARVVDATRC